MKVEKYDGGPEREAVTALITDRAVLARAAPHWTEHALPSRWSCLVGSWCVDYFRRHDDAPGKVIESLYSSYAASRKGQADPEMLSTLEGFLARLSDDYEASGSSQYRAEMVLELMDECRWREFLRRMQGAVERGDFEEAERLRNEFRRIGTGAQDYVDVFLDAEAARQAFATVERDPLIVWDDALGEFFGREFDRGCMVAFLAPPKRGKTWWMMNVAWKAVLQRRRVAFFEVGDMTRDQTVRRFHQRAALRPLRAGEVDWPISMAGGDPPRIQYENRKYEDALDWRDGMKSMAKLHENMVRDHHGYLRAVCTPTRSTSTEQIAGTLEGWAASGWVADVVVVDYADLIARPRWSANSAEATDTIWGELRKVAGEFDCCVVTATQTKAEAIGARTVLESHWSGSKMILAHVTALVGISADDSEVAESRCRLNMLECRDASHNKNKSVAVAGCLAAGSPSIRSVWCE